MRRLIQYKETQCPQVDALPFLKLHPQTPQYADTAAELEARAAVLRALS